MKSRLSVQNSVQVSDGETRIQIQVIWLIRKKPQQMEFFKHFIIWTPDYREERLWGIHTSFGSRIIFLLGVFMG